MLKGTSSLIAILLILIIVGIGTSGYILTKKSSEISETTTTIPKIITTINRFIDFAKTTKFVLEFYHFDKKSKDYTTMKICENDPTYSISMAEVRFTWYPGTEIWHGFEELPSKNVSIRPGKFWEMPGRPCVVFPSNLREDIGGPYGFGQTYIAYKTETSPESLSCDIDYPNAYCAKFYYFDKIMPIELGSVYVGPAGRPLPDFDVHWGYYCTGAVESKIKLLKKDNFTEVLKLYEEGNVGYMFFKGLNVETKVGYGNYTTCTPKVKLTPSKDVNILVVFAYSNQSILEEAINTLKGTTKDKSIKYVADWYKSKAVRLIDKPVNIAFTFLDGQYRVDMNLTQIVEEYEIFDEIGNEEKFLYEKLIQPLKQQGVNFDSYDAALVLYDNPELFKQGIWVSVGHADRHRGYAYINLGSYSGSGFDENDYKNIVWISAHELGHVFGACDLWKTLYPRDCLMGQRPFSITLSDMELCAYKDVGWDDIDGDGIIEIDDPCPFDKQNFCK